MIEKYEEEARKGGKSHGLRRSDRFPSQHMSMIGAPAGAILEF
jgi:hypothetical protein